jgi:2-C-methyl-D-erythritol 4-phosphate cytidylyltransferase
MEPHPAPIPDPPGADAARVAAIIVAAGAGHRFGGAKQFAELRGRRLLDWSISAARSTCATIVAVVPPDLVDRDRSAADVVVAGGATRSGSVRAGLAAVPDHVEVIVVHDAARPLAPPSLFRSVIDAVRAGADSAIPGVAVVDTLRRLDAGPPVDRDALMAVQTPQAFDAGLLRKVHALEPEASDDASLIDAAGGKVIVVPGVTSNRKVTEPIDLVIAEVLAAEPGATAEVEIGDRGGR